MRRDIRLNICWPWDRVSFIQHNSNWCTESNYYEFPASIYKTNNIASLTSTGSSNLFYKSPYQVSQTWSSSSNSHTNSSVFASI